MNSGVYTLFEKDKSGGIRNLHEKNKIPAI